MAKSRPIVRAAVWFIIVYGLLAAPWPGLQENYSKAFRWAGEKVFGNYGDTGAVRFEPIGRPDRTSDTGIKVGIRGLGYVGPFPISPRLLGYLPTVEVIALILVSSVAWKRRAPALILGLVLVHAFIYARVLLMIRIWYTSNDDIKLHDPSPWVRAVLDHTNEVINVAPTAGFIIPVLIWILVTFRYADISAILRKQMPAVQSSPVEKAK